MIEYPELQLLALIVVTVKLLFPFDGLKRFPLKKHEPVIATVDWETWAWTRQYGEKKQRPDKAAGEPALSYSEAMRLACKTFSMLHFTECSRVRRLHRRRLQQTSCQRPTKRRRSAKLV